MNLRLASGIQTEDIMPIVTCKHLDSFLDDYLAGRLVWWTRLQFQVHLTLCPPCKVYLDQYRRTVEAAHALSAPEPPATPMPPELAESITRLMCTAEQRDEKR